MTTPNAEFNALFPRLEGRFRHPDHRFEWSRAAFAAWAIATAKANVYAVDMRPVGKVDATYGPATQMAVFRLN